MSQAQLVVGLITLSKPACKGRQGKVLLCKSPKDLCYKAAPGSTGSASDKVGITFAATRNCVICLTWNNVLGLTISKTPNNQSVVGVTLLL